MTETVETVADVGSLDRTIKKVASPVDAERAAIRELVVAARARGEDQTGPDGLLKLLTKTVLETALEEEMTEHLGYDKHAVEGRNRENSRNGKRSKTVLTDAVGPVEIEVPRDRGRHLCAGDRGQAATPPGRRRHGGVVAVCQGPDHRGDQRALRRGLRGVGEQGHRL